MVHRGKVQQSIMPQDANIYRHTNVLRWYIRKHSKREQYWWTLRDCNNQLVAVSSPAGFSTRKEAVDNVMQLNHQWFVRG